MSPLDPNTAATLSAALAAGAAETVAEINALFLAIAGIRTVTWLATAPDRSVTHRIGTSNTRDFPIGGFDPIDDSAWNRRIFGEKKPIIGDDVPGMTAFIPETGHLVAMGYGATACVPIVIAGEVRGTVNFLGDSGIFSADTLARITSLLPIAALIFTFPGISER